MFNTLNIFMRIGCCAYAHAKKHPIPTVQGRIYALSSKCFVLIFSNQLVLAAHVGSQYLGDVDAAVRV